MHSDIVIEVKLGIAICLLAGGDTYDLVVINEFHFDYYKMILYKVLLKWVIQHGIGDMKIVKYLGDK